jgi:uncharacterized cupredoxin-like copper-binding protein
MVERLIACTVFLLWLAGANAAHAAGTESLGIKLQDSSTDPSIAHMHIVIDHDKLKPGRVMLQAENQSRTLVHEVIVVRVNGHNELPFDAKHDRVNENRLRRLGEIADLAPGMKGKLALNLEPGTYLLFCNQPGHYKDGMVTRLTVAR